MSIILLRLHRHRRETECARSGAARKPLFLTLALTLILSGALIQPQPAHADDYVPGTTLYLLDNQGATDVTFTYSPQDGTVVSATGFLVSVTLNYTEGHLYDLHGNVIGYIF